MPAPEWTPETADVGALIRSRLRDGGGHLRDDFTNDTEPSKDQVETLIRMATDYVVSRVGDLTDACATSDMRESAGSLTALYAAMLVEQGYFSEQIESNRSPYNALRDMFDKSIVVLTESVAERCGGGNGESVGGAGASPLGRFPAPSNMDRRAW